MSVDALLCLLGIRGFSHVCVGWGRGMRCFRVGQRVTCLWLKAESTGGKALRVVSSVIFDQRWYQNVVRTKKRRTRRSVSMMISTLFEAFCDLSLNRHKARWNIFVLYNGKKRTWTNLPCSAWLLEDLCKVSHFPHNAQFHISFFSSLSVSLSFCQFFSPKVFPDLQLLKAE